MLGFYEALGRRIARLRKDKAWSQEELAERSSITTSYLARIETGMRRPTLEVLQKIASSLEAPVWRILADERHSLEERDWQGSARRLANAIRRLDTDDLELLAALAERIGDESASPRLRAAEQSAVYNRKTK